MLPVLHFLRFGKLIFLVCGVFSVLFVLGALTLVVLGTEFGRQAGEKCYFECGFSLGVDLPQDEHGLTNILLIGVGGGAYHADKGINLPIR